MPVKCHYLCARALETHSKSWYWGMPSAGSFLPIQRIALWFLLNPLNIMYCDWATRVPVSWQTLICCLANWQERQNKKMLSMWFRHSAMAALIGGFFGLPGLMIYSQSARYCSFEFVWGSTKDLEAKSQGSGGTSRPAVWSYKLCFLWRLDLKKKTNKKLCNFLLKQAYTFSM